MWGGVGRDVIYTPCITRVGPVYGVVIVDVLALFIGPLAHDLTAAANHEVDQCSTRALSTFTFLRVRHRPPSTILMPAAAAQFFSLLWFVNSGDTRSVPLNTTAAAAVGLGSDVRERPWIYSSFSRRLGTCGACACGRIRIHLGNSGWLSPEPAFKLSLWLEMFSLLIVQIFGSIGFRISYAQIKYFETMKGLFRDLLLSSPLYNRTVFKRLTSAMMDDHLLASMMCFISMGEEEHWTHL